MITEYSSESCFVVTYPGKKSFVTAIKPSFSNIQAERTLPVLTFMNKKYFTSDTVLFKNNKDVDMA